MAIEQGQSSNKRKSAKKQKQERKKATKDPHVSKNSNALGR
jgi:hypothetical protein